jgi:chemotaxis protein CheC
MAKILTIDDSLYMRKKIANILKEDGHEILEAEDGLKGLQMAHSLKPDCILLDLIMPDMDGMKVLKSLSESDSTVPVIVITADIQESVQKQCLELGVHAFINKPPREEEVRNAVNKVIPKKEETEDYLTPAQMDILKELINIGIGRAAAVLNEMTSFHINLEVPFIKVLSHKGAKKAIEELGSYRIAAVRLGFKGPFSGTAALVFPSDSASKLVAVLTGEEPGTPDLDSVRAGTLSEVGNIVINGVMGSIGNIIKQHISYSIPTYMEDTIDNLLVLNGVEVNPLVLLVRTRFTIQQLQVEGDIILLFEVGSFDSLIANIDKIKKKLRI